jgi:hypothetical protein
MRWGTRHTAFQMPSVFHWLDQRMRKSDNVLPMSLAERG